MKQKQTKKMNVNRDLTVNDFKEFIGLKVIKISRHPFKSMLKVNTVKDVIVHPVTNRPAFTFFEDDSYVECMMCEKFIPPFII